MTNYIQVFVSIDNKDNAKILAKKILENKLGACVQLIDGINSFYWWKSNIDESNETLLLIKTKSDLYDNLEKFIKENHSYDIPEIIIMPIVGGNKDYFGWIEENLG
ncbi:MAG: divalent-cation tolerance protein CutA [Candidatus Gracilibacteria bacterium]|nr:divalent-cation tolerance protein CutA [Candidatus Gracilibacteria bacterium]